MAALDKRGEFYFVAGDEATTLLSYTICLAVMTLPLGLFSAFSTKEKEAPKRRSQPQNRWRLQIAEIEALCVVFVLETLTLFRNRCAMPTFGLATSISPIILLRHRVTSMIIRKS